MENGVTKISDKIPPYILGVKTLLQPLTTVHLMTLYEEFDNAERPWISLISKEIKDWFGTQKFVDRCINGEMEAITGVILGFWPFVRQFPKQILRVGHKIGSDEIKERFKKGNYKGFGGTMDLVINLIELPSFKKNVLKLLNAPEGDHIKL